MRCGFPLLLATLLAGTSAPLLIGESAAQLVQHPFFCEASVRLRGRIDVDAIATSQSTASRATFGDLGDAIGIRRAWIGAEGELGRSRRYVAEIDLASGVVEPRDVFVALGEATHRERRLGHFREPFSLEGGTATTTYAFLEQSPINILDPARSWGGGIFRANPDESSTLALGIFHAGIDASDFQVGDGSTLGLTARLTTAPINENDSERLLHLGIAFSERFPEQGAIVINQRPSSPLLQFGDSPTSPFVPTISIPADFQQLINLQIATAQGPIWTQAEWYGAFIDQRGGEPVIFYHGCHADCGWFITGEHRAYLASGGVFGPVRVNRPIFAWHTDDERSRGWGAWELTARYAFLDFLDSAAPTGPSGQLVGIRLGQATFGTNWYLADHIRLMFNYTYSEPTEPNTGTTAAHTFSSRLAVFW